ncbi:MAG TPA: putative Ig domain-containing protein [Bryobacteraceae bacterium]|nr:putative Ig domain-containing protein [Bryobacteraceae bacterium]
MVFTRSIHTALIAFALGALGQLSAFAQPLSITSYTQVSQTRGATRSQLYLTYEAVLSNTGPALPSVNATVTSLAGNVMVVAGQNTLFFAPVPANSSVTSSNTFTILVDTSQPWSLADLQWSFQNPVANPGPDQTVHVGDTVTLNGSGSTNPSGAGSLTYSWTFVNLPPGSNATLSNPNQVIATFVADVPGTYGIQLTVSNGFGSNSAIVTVTTAASAPVANAGSNQTVTAGSLVFLNGTGSFDPAGSPLTYLWSFVSLPLGSQTTLFNFRSATANFVADVAGTYIIQLVVNNGTSNSLPSTVTVTTGNTPPVANAGRNQSVDLNTIVQLSGAGSTDVNGNRLTYSWTLNTTQAPGSHANLSNPSSVNPTFTPDVPGTYVAQLIVNDGILNSQPATVTITTNALLPPTAVPSAIPNTIPGATVTLNGARSSDPQGLPLTYSWALIKVPQASTATLSATNTVNPSFISDLPGTYIAQLIVNDGYLSSPPATVTISTADVPPVANAGPNQNVVTGTTVTLDGSQSFDPDGQPLSYSWVLLNVPAHSTASLTGANTVKPTFTADVAGTYVAQLIVSDPFLSGTPSTVTITAGSMTLVLSPSTLNLSGSPQNLTLTVNPPNGANPLPVTLTGFDPTVVSITSPVTVPANSGSASVPVTPVGQGTTSVIASATGYLSATASITVGSQSISITFAKNASGVGVTHTISGTITLSTPAPASGATVALSALPAGLVTFNPSNVAIPAGSSTGSFTLTGTAIGAAAITASAPGYASGTTSILVVSLGGVVVTPGVSVGFGQSATLNIQLSSPAPIDGEIINLISSNKNVLTVTPSVTISPGATIPAVQPQVTGVALGQVTVTASGGGYVSGSATVSVVSSLNVTCPANSTGEVGIAFNSGLISVSGGTAPYTFSISGTLPAGLTLNTSTGAVTGTPTTSGSFSVQVVDSKGAPGSSCPITINPVVSITCPASATGEVGVLFSSGPVTVTGGIAPFTFSIVGALPAGLTLNTSTGAVSGTPTAAGSFSVQVKDAAGAGGMTCKITIAPPILITCPAGITGEVGVAYNSGALTVSGGTSPYTFSIVGTLPAGLTLNASNGAVTGTPTAPGSFSIQVKDASGAVGTSCVITINPPPSLTCPAKTTGEVGVAFNTGTPTASGGIAPYTFSVVGTLPAGLTLNTSTGAVTGTPTAPGTFSVQVKDANGIVATGACMITIAGPPMLTCPAGALTVGVATNSLLTVSGGVAPFTFSVASGALPAGLTLNNSTGAITGTPTATGGFIIQVKDVNGVVASTPCTFTVQLPVLTITSSSMSPGTAGIAYSFQPLTSGGTLPFTWTITGLPRGFTYNPSTGLISGPAGSPYTGTFSVTISASDSSLPQETSTVTLSLVIRASTLTITTPPTLSNATANTLYVAQITATGGLTPYSWSATNLPSWLTFDVNGSVCGIPISVCGTPSTSETDSFTIGVSDSSSPQQTASQTFSLTVNLPTRGGR